MGFFDFIIAIIQGIVEGITEWLPVSSTGHLILIENMMGGLFTFKNPDFVEMFRVVIQLGAILAVVILFWNKIFPFNVKQKTKDEPFVKSDIMMMWIKILVASVPAGVVGVLFDEVIDKVFYRPFVVAIALIFYGVLFIVVENWNKKKTPTINSVAEITYRTALIIGVFQLLAAIIPGTSRSGATIIGALIIGVSRAVAAEFTFYLAIPAMLGASLLKVVKFGTMSGAEFAVLFVGMLVSFIVSMFVIKFLMGYIRKHDFKVFGYYRIVLGIIVLLAFYVI